MRIGLMVNSMREDAMEYARRAVAFLQSKGVKVYAEDDVAVFLGEGVRSFAQAHDVTAVISMGGDGTLLRGAQYAMRWDAALLGINLGRVGFLTEVEPADIESALTAVIEGNYTTQTRPVLNISVGQSTWYALNDAVLSRGGNTRLITIDALVDGESSGRYVGDGIVVATPTGSTGYSLSAGGPVVAPKVDCMVITPICAHTLQHRPSVVHGGAHITLELLPEDEQTASLQVDGLARTTLRSGERVEIRMDQHCVRLIRIKPERFFQLVRDKLTEWTR